MKLNRADKITIGILIYLFLLCNWTDYFEVCCTGPAMGQTTVSYIEQIDVTVLSHTYASVLAVYGVVDSMPKSKPKKKYNIPENSILRARSKTLIEYVNARQNLQWLHSEQLLQEIHFYNSILTREKRGYGT
jgi:hypothetical protein